ncbi:glucose-1-phosphate cytidylyltransferase [Alteribacter aurantiacus]|uniref:glucose-1-phosphate cytidylyltransferase n=1 Tax=Alteribacter aurantiacus TaxID=254410 RepID=UPI0004011A8C|nr:glucose-1-phosphate cytidylyltransferase [Alteribacter aurantiacus]
MKVVILAGGYGTRLSELTDRLPKPMVKIGELPILIHIMKIYSTFGFTDFIICLGYKGEIIKEYFSHYFLYNSDITFDYSAPNKFTVHNTDLAAWTVTLVDTGLDTMTGGRIKRVEKYVGQEDFLLTYGDGLIGDIDINQIVNFHKTHGKMATLTATRPGGRFGVLSINEKNSVTEFEEKVEGSKGFVNGGFMVLKPSVFKLIDGDHSTFENDPLQTIAKQRQLMAYKHNGFWYPMDSLRDQQYLERLWVSGTAPWKVWGESKSNTMDGDT